MHRLIAFLSASLIAFPVFPAAQAASGVGVGVDVVVDTDMLSDDWTSLLYLAKTAHIQAVTISATGATYCEPGRKNARYLLTLALGRRESQTIPVACGPDKPLDGSIEFPRPFRDEASAMPKLAGYPPANDDSPRGDAVETLRDALAQSREPVTFVALGPLTNLALLLRKYPAIRTKIKKVVVMGGAIHVPGNIVIPGMTDHLHNTAAEWNLYADPVAAHETFVSGIPVYLVPLDATNQVPLTMSFFERLENQKLSPAGQLIVAAHRQLANGIASGRFYFWDPLAAISAIDDRVCQFAPIHVDVAIGYRDRACRTSTTGRCEFDERETGHLVASLRSPAIHYCHSVDTALFYRVLGQAFLN